MADRKAPCSRQREILLEIFLSEGESANLPSELNQHLRDCASCMHYWSSLGVVRLHTRRTGSIRHSCGQRLSGACAKEIRRSKSNGCHNRFCRSAEPFILFRASGLADGKAFYVLDLINCGRMRGCVGNLAGRRNTRDRSFRYFADGTGYIRFGDEEVAQGRTGLPSTADINGFPLI